MLSRVASRADDALRRISEVFSGGGDSLSGCDLSAAAYADADGAVAACDILVDATPRGMHEGDAPIVDTALFHEGQAVLDTVYAHGETALVCGARESGARASDGLMMLVEQAALTVEIWARALGLGDIEAPRDVMRAAVGAL